MVLLVPYHFCTPTIDVCKENQNKVIEAHIRDKEKYHKTRKETRRRVVYNVQREAAANNGLTRMQRRQAAGRLGKAHLIMDSMYTSAFPKVPALHKREGSPRGSPSPPTSLPNSPREGLYCDCCKAKREALAHRPHSATLQKAYSPKRRHPVKAPPEERDTATNPTHLSPATVKLNDELHEHHQLLLTSGGDDTQTVLEHSTSEGECLVTTNLGVMVGDLLKEAGLLKSLSERHNSLSSVKPIGSNNSTPREREKEKKKPPSRHRALRPVTAPPRGTLRSRSPVMRKGAAARDTSPEKKEEEICVEDKGKSKDIDKSMERQLLVMKFKMMARKVGHLGAVLKKMTQAEKAQAAKGRRAVLDAQLEKDLKQVDHATSSKQTVAADNKKRAEILRQIPLQKQWFVLVTLSTPAILFAETASRIVSSRRTALQQAYAMHTLKRYFVPYIEYRRKRVEHAKGMIRQLVQIYKMRKIKDHYRRNIDMVYTCLISLNGVHKIKRAIGLFIDNVRKAQLGVRRMLQKRHAQRDLLVLQFNHLEEKMIKAKISLQADLYSLREDIQLFATAKGIKAEVCTLNEYNTQTLDKMITERTVEIRSKGRKGKGKKKNQALDPEETAKVRKECLMTYLSKLGAQLAADSVLREIGEKTKLIHKRPFVSEEAKMACVAQAVRQRSRIHTAELEMYAEKMKQVQKNIRVAEAKRLLGGGNVGVPLNIPEPPKPHFQLFLPQKEMLRLIATCRQSSGLPVPQEYQHS